MNTRETNDPFSEMNMSRQQMALTTQLSQAATSMHHIDELFQWLSYALIQRFNIQLLLFWTNHVNQTGQLTAQLRTIACQDSSFPEQIVVNEQMQRIAQHLISKRLAYKPQPIENLFSNYQTILLKRYGLHYWGACFTSGNALLPPRADILSHGETPAFFAMTTLLFLRQLPQFSVVPATSTILEEATELAKKRGLLLPTTDPQTPLPSLPLFQFPPQEVAASMQDAPLTLIQLIPGRKQDADTLLSSNPFARPAAISDKKARRLHTAIDGRANVAELCSITGLTIKEASVALRALWDQHHIEVHEPGGKPVNLLRFLNDR